MVDKITSPVGANELITKVNDVIDALPTVMTGATSSAAGASGLVPAPAAGDNTKFLRGDGTYAEAGGSAMQVVDYTE